MRKLTRILIASMLVLIPCNVKAGAQSRLAQRETAYPMDSLSRIAPPLPTLPTSNGYTTPVAVEQPLLGDVFLEQLLYAGSSVLEWLGWQDAALHMRHYLDGSGETLAIDPQRMLDAMPAFYGEVEAEAAHFLDQIGETISAEYHGADMLRTYRAYFGDSGWKGSYATRDRSQNWYFAVGGFAYTFTAAVTVTRPERQSGTPVAHIILQLHVYDRYDWDSGRGTNIAGIRVANEVIARLQAVGLAKEYIVVGHADPIQVDVPLGTGGGRWPAQ